MVEWRKRNIECMQTSRKLKTRKRKKARRDNKFRRKKYKARLRTDCPKLSCEEFLSV